MSLPWTHNPTATKYIDGTFVIFHIGIGKPNGKPHTNCSNGSTIGPGSQQLHQEKHTDVPHLQEGDALYPAVSWSKSVFGPWTTQNGTRDGWGVNNPAPCE